LARRRERKFHDLDVVGFVRSNYDVQDGEKVLWREHFAFPSQMAFFSRRSFAQTFCQLKVFHQFFIKRIGSGN
jgi:hypothetical protein